MPKNDDHHNSEDGTTQPAKRRKVTIACDECRSRKTKCDGKRPVCGPCYYSGREDRCEWGSRKTNSDTLSREYIMSLGNRIKKLEQGQRSHGTLDKLSHMSNPHLLYSPTDFAAPIVSDTSSILTHPTRSSVSNIQSPFEGATAMMGPVEDDPKSHGFFGTSSAGSFMKQVKAAIDSKTNSPGYHGTTPKTPDKVLLSSLMPENKAASSRNRDYVLPSRKTADGLLGVYWSLVHPLYPFLHRAETEAIYHKLWTGEGKDDDMDLCLLNILLALSSQLKEDIKPNQRQANANVFFLRAREFLYNDFWEGGSIRTVQCLLLMGQYLQSTNDPQRCWMVVGLAVRLAQSLGLHLEETLSRLQSIREQELVKKVWGGCVLMDRAVCMTLGRPGMISRANAVGLPTPLCINEEYLTDEMQPDEMQQKHSPSIMAFLEKSLPLYEIVNEILVAFYNPLVKTRNRNSYDLYFGGPIIKPQGQSNNNVYQLENATVFQLDAALTEWTKSLPEHLHPSYTLIQENPTFLRQANIIWARYLQVRLLLFRPILSTLCKSAESYQTLSKIPFTTRIAFQSSITCIHTAQELINLIHDNLPENPSAFGALPAWWYLIMYIYTAATVLVASRLVLQCRATSVIDEELSHESISKSWVKAIDILKIYRDHNPVAQKSILALEMMWSKIPQRFEVFQQQQEHPQSQAHNGHSRDDHQESAPFHVTIDTSRSISIASPPKALVMPSDPESTQTPAIEIRNQETHSHPPQMPPFSNPTANPGIESQINQFGAAPVPPQPRNLGGGSDFFANFHYNTWDPYDMSWLDSAPSHL